MNHSPTYLRNYIAIRKQRELFLTVKRFSVSSSSCMHSQLYKAEKTALFRIFCTNVQTPRQENSRANTTWIFWPISDRSRIGFEKQDQNTVLRSSEKQSASFYVSEMTYTVSSGTLNSYCTMQRHF